MASLDVDIVFGSSRQPLVSFTPRTILTSPVGLEVIFVRFLGVVVLDLSYLRDASRERLGSLQQQPELSHLPLLHVAPVVPHDPPVNVEVVSPFLRRDVFPESGDGPPADFLHGGALPAQALDLLGVPELQDLKRFAC